jgi:hypothetical protein
MTTSIATVRPTRSSSPAAARTGRTTTPHIEQKNWHLCPHAHRLPPLRHPGGGGCAQALYTGELRLLQNSCPR